MLRFAQTCEAIGATIKKLEKTALVADYLRSLLPTTSLPMTSQTLPLSEAATAAIFLSGSPFAANDEATLQVGGALLWRLIAELSGKSEHELTEIYRKHGDAGSVAAEALPAKPDSGFTLTEVQRAFLQIAAARGPTAKAALLRQLMERATPLEAKYIVKIISGDLRIGLKQSLVEEAIARAFEAPLDQVERANMLLGGLGETLRLASTAKLADARLRLFHAMDFMLASPVESSEEALSYFQNASIEDKYDGIRAQAHISWDRNEVRIFSRTRDEITESFPELCPSLARVPKDVIFDGEIVAWNSDGSSSSGGRALPFATLQQRLGRKKVIAKLMRDVPVAYLVFDVLYVDGELLLDRPLQERAIILDQLVDQITVAQTTIAQKRIAETTTETASSGPPGTFRFCYIRTSARDRSPRSHRASELAAQIETLFTAARAQVNEGLMIKDLDSLYTPGRRGKSWLKMKRELATLDVVVTAVEYGHGKRIGVLSDYTFAVWDDERLVNIGKAYSGLTDAEITEMTKWFLAHKISEQGLRLEVEPKIVLEVAFNNMMRSSRHESGYALRFPRILRLHPDKLPEDADTLETVKEIYDRQHSA